MVELGFKSSCVDSELLATAPTASTSQCSGCVLRGTERDQVNIDAPSSLSTIVLSLSLPSPSLPGTIVSEVVTLWHVPA